ncbi:hypothetical protein SHAM105786_16575 [Shewanella amazonensis]|nr:hypothetical protein [Shewanella amazonensis]
MQQTLLAAALVAEPGATSPVGASLFNELKLTLTTDTGKASGTGTLEVRP